MSSDSVGNFFGSFTIEPYPDSELQAIISEMFLYPENDFVDPGSSLEWVRSFWTNIVREQPQPFVSELVEHLGIEYLVDDILIHLRSVPIRDNSVCMYPDGFIETNVCRIILQYFYTHILVPRGYRLTGEILEVVIYDSSVDAEYWNIWEDNVLVRVPTKLPYVKRTKFNTEKFLKKVVKLACEFAPGTPTELIEAALLAKFPSEIQLLRERLDFSRST